MAAAIDTEGDSARNKVDAPRSAAVTRNWKGVSAANRVAERRQRLLDAALELFGTRGIAAVSIEQICNEAGLTRRYFYESFESIDVIAEATIQLAAIRLVATAMPLVAEHGPTNPVPTIAALAKTLPDARVLRLLAIEASSPRFAELRDRLFDYAAMAWEAALRDHLPRPLDPVRLRLHTQMLFGGVADVLGSWVDGRLDLTADELGDLLVEYSHGWLEQALEFMMVPEP